jgi:hypothetical protein
MSNLGTYYMELVNLNLGLSGLRAQGQGYVIPERPQAPTENRMDWGYVCSKPTYIT